MTDAVQDVRDWIDNGMAAGALNFSETLRDSIKALARCDCEAKLTALVEAIDREINRQRGHENTADYNGSFAGSAEARSKIKLLEGLKALTHHSAPVGEANLRPSKAMLSAISKAAMAEWGDNNTNHRRAHRILAAITATEKDMPNG